MFNNDDMPAGSINQGKIKATKTYIGTLLQQIEPGIQITNENIDSVIATKLVENEIDTTQTQLNQLTALLTQLQKEKKGGKKHKSKRYRKSRKQRKTKTKRRLRRSYKYK